MSKAAIRNLQQDFVVLTPGLSMQAVANHPGVYEDLSRDFNGFKGHTLVACHAFTGDWPTWERHPLGDEAVCLLSGEADMILRLPEGDQRVTLNEPGQYVIVPANTWHTAKIARAATMMFCTPGEGTENVDCAQME